MLALTGGPRPDVLDQTGGELWPRSSHPFAHVHRCRAGGPGGKGGVDAVTQLGVGALLEVDPAAAPPVRDLASGDDDLLVKPPAVASNHNQSGEDGDEGSAQHEVAGRREADGGDAR